MYLLVTLLLSATTAIETKHRELKASDLSALTWRSVGPANAGGRVADICLAPDNGKTFFVAFGTGGLWKTTNRGTTFTPVFDKQSTSSIGSVVVADAPENWSGWKAETNAPSDKDKRSQEGKAKIIWVGTGEGNGRNSSSWGDGVYRSTNGGTSWTHVGLEDSKDIPRLAVDPRNPDVCYAAAMGHLWGPNKMRGIYKTTDGGKSWTPSLQIDDNTGAIDVILDPKNPEIVFAAMEMRRRTPFSFSSAGDKGGLYRSRDGGRHWDKLSKGLPNQTGRIGVDVSKSNSKVIMAEVESDEGGGRNLDDGRSRHGGVFRSEDGGDTWTRMNANAPRAFYFSKVRIDPKNDRRVYLLGYDLWLSTDGGKTFIPGLTEKLHVDWHAMAIDPADPEHLLVGSDGGLYQSFDQGVTWDFMNQMAVGLFYNVAVDNSSPFRIIGGLQDNGTWLGPSQTKFEAGSGPTGTGISNGDWKSVGGGDGFHVDFDPTDVNTIYSESQGAGIGRADLANGTYRGIRPDTKEGQSAFRFNWNSPFFVSSFDPNVLYLGGNYVFKLVKRGEEWEKISPDLTTRDPLKMDTVGSSAETYCTVVALAESHLAKGLLWSGSDDGLIHVTEDDGKNWKNVTPKEIGGRYVANVEPSHIERNTLYCAIDGHRNDDYDPMILMTEDLGHSWHNITGDLPKGQSVRVVREDIFNKSVLYAGTENGIYVSADRGKLWAKLNTDSLPTVGVHDIVEQAREISLVAATHGRSVWVLDDASALSQLTQEVMDKAVHLFQPKSASPRQRFWLDGFWGDKFFHAPDAALGAAIPYWCRDKVEGGVSIKIENQAGETITSLAGPGNAGINQVIWDMQPDAKHRLPNRGEDLTVFVPAGKYKLSVTMAGKTETKTLEITPYPYNADAPVPPVSSKSKNGKDDD